MENRKCRICDKVLCKRYSESRLKFQFRKYCSRSCFYTAWKALDRSTWQRVGRKLGTVAESWTTEQRLQASIRVRGEKHWNWKGGVAKDNQRARHTFQYKNWARQVLIRDKRTCKLCGNLGKTAHHIKKFSDFLELRYEIDNGITLCSSCHKTVTWREEQFEELFTSLVRGLVGACKNECRPVPLVETYS